MKVLPVTSLYRHQQVVELQHTSGKNLMMVVQTMQMFLLVQVEQQIHIQLEL